MSYQFIEFQAGQNAVFWLIAMVAIAIAATIFGMLISLIQFGLSGPGRTVETVFRGVADLIMLSSRRIGAIAILTFKEAQRRRAFMIGALFVLLFMFGGWFLGEADLEKPAKPYVSFVMWSMQMLLLLMTILVSCWGLPADIKARSLHTVVTKPVRRSEIVLGRMFGYAGVITLVLFVTAILGYFWIQRQVPERAKNQLVARVPVFGKMTFLDRNGEFQKKGVNVGDIWEYRSFIEGLSKSRAIWTFENLDVETIKKEGVLRLEQNFEVFRTYKGNIDEQVRFSVTLVNPETDLHVRLPDTYEAHEFSRESVLTEDSMVSVVEVPTELEYRDSYELDSPEKTANLFDDLIQDGRLVVEIGCVDAQQFLGTAREDMFIRMPDRSFLVTYSKSVFSIWLLLMLFVFIGTTASCFLKGPVATMLTASVILLGQSMREQMKDMLIQLASEKKEVLGGGTFESLYRLITRMNQTVPMPENWGTSAIKYLDGLIFQGLGVVYQVIPNLNYYDTSKYVANGFDVPWEVCLEPAIFSTIGYFIPLVIIGYFSLQLRELESK